MSNLEMSLEMSVYNRAKKWSKASGLTDVGRVNRALGQSGFLILEGSFPACKVRFNKVSILNYSKSVERFRKVEST